jgi:surface polysaccharide O-acyltransferase-like enzyme
MSKTRDFRLDLLRVMATIMVVFSHVVVYLLERTDFIGGKVWWISYFLSSICRIATPIFFMLSGYLFSQKKMSFEDSRKRALTRLMIPYMFFSTLGAVFYNWIEFRITVFDFLSKLYFGGATHLYFLLGLFVLYLLNPIIRKLMDPINEINKNKVVWGLLFASSFLSLLAHFLGYSSLLTNSVVYWFLALGYYLFGLYYSQIRRFFIKISNLKMISVLVVVVLINFMLSIKLGGFINPINMNLAKPLSDYFQNYFSIFQMITVLLVFVLVLENDLGILKVGGVKRVLSFVSDKSYGLYLSHMMILEYLTHKTIINTYDGSVSLYMFIILAFVISVVIGLIISYVVSRVRYLRIVVGINDFKRLK